MPPAAPGQNAARRAQGKRPGDLTGLRNQQLSRQAAALKAETATQNQDSLEAQRLAKLTEEVDYSSEARAREREAALSNVVEETEVEVRPKTERIRVLDDVKDMTFGREIISEAEYDENGNMTKFPALGPLRNLNFEVGVWYTVDADVAGHLRHLGYVMDI